MGHGLKKTTTCVLYPGLPSIIRVPFLNVLLRPSNIPENESTAVLTKDKALVLLTLLLIDLGYIYQNGVGGWVGLAIGLVSLLGVPAKATR